MDTINIYLEEHKIEYNQMDFGLVTIFSFFLCKMVMFTVYISWVFRRVK
jgi:hypothetical protein